MSGVLGQLTEFSTGLLRANHFCMGKRRGKRYVCGDDVSNPKVIDNAIELLIEAINRMLKWRVWDTWWIDGHRNEWLVIRKNIEEKLRNKYDDEVVNSVLKLVNEFTIYIGKFRKYWSENTMWSEVKKMIDNLIYGKTEVIIWENENGVSVHSNYITLNVSKATENGITVQLILKEFDGITINVPDVYIKTLKPEDYEKFINEVLKWLKKGFAMTDEGVNEERPIMVTTQVWQAILWSLLYPGEMYINIDAINVNKEGISVKWYLRANGHNSLKTLESDKKPSNENEAILLLLTAILGDGYVIITKYHGRYDTPVISITMKTESFNKWEPILSKLSIRWRKYQRGSKTEVMWRSGHAIDLTRIILNVLPPIFKDMLDALGPKKWINMKKIAEIELNWRLGKNKVLIAGYEFSVNVLKTTVRLRHLAKNKDEVDMIRKALMKVYGDKFISQTHINGNGKYMEVIIPMRLIMEYNDIKMQVIQVLCKILKKTKDEQKRQTITNHIMKLIPTVSMTACR